MKSLRRSAGTLAVLASSVAVILTAGCDGRAEAPVAASATGSTPASAAAPAPAAPAAAQPPHAASTSAPAAAASPTPHVVTGLVVDAAGKPLAGARILVDNTLFYNSNISTRTGPDGRYRVQVPNGAWRVYGHKEVDYHGRTYRLALHPDNPDGFAGNEGAARNFQVKLTGKQPEPQTGDYGGKVLVNTAVGDYSVAPADVVLTLRPDGPLVDGSEGQPITGSPVSTGDGWALPDVPIGRYAITARVAPAEGGGGGEPAPLRVRVGTKGEFRESVTADFDAPYGDLPIYRIAVEVKRP